MEKLLQPENQRFKIFRETLKLSQLEFADALGRKQGSISDIERGRNTVDGIVKLLELKFKLNREWLETGNGSMFINHNTLSDHDISYKPMAGKSLLVPIYDIAFDSDELGKLVEKGGNDYTVGFLSIPEVSGCDAVIRAKGDSMSPRINDGDWVGVKRMTNWDKWIPLNYIYAIMTADVELIKYIKKGSSEDMLKIVSVNPKYDDDEIPKRLIKEMWSVKTILPLSKMETLI